MRAAAAAGNPGVETWTVRYTKKVLVKRALGLSTREVTQVTEEYQVTGWPIYDNSNVLLTTDGKSVPSL